MPDSGPVVKALEETFAALIVHDSEGCGACESARPVVEAALDLAREQEALLREYRENHLATGCEGDSTRRCELCERTRKVLS